MMSVDKAGYVEMVTHHPVHLPHISSNFSFFSYYFIDLLRGSTFTAGLALYPSLTTQAPQRA
jgi:hypothetical protein